jgi:hypothetical protein
LEILYCEDIKPITPPDPCELQKQLIKQDLEWVDMVSGINEDFLGSKRNKECIEFDDGMAFDVSKIEKMPKIPLDFDFNASNAVRLCQGSLKLYEGLE